MDFIRATIRVLPMPLLRFLRQLFDHGRVTVEETAALDVADPRLAELLQELDHAHRQQLPREMPPLRMETAVFGALILYRAAQVLTYRDTRSEGLHQAIVNGPTACDASEQSSADLCLHFLPDLARLARAAATSDPLVECLLELGARWPLSSVGIAGVQLNDDGQARVNELAKHPAAWRLYVDRVLQTGDASRLADPATKAAARAAVGAFPQLAGKLTKELEDKKEVPAA
jgi:hypothetical protein